MREISCACDMGRLCRCALDGDGGATRELLMTHVALLLRLAALTGQRPGDVRRMSEEDLRDGVLHVRQGKVAAKLRIEVTGT